MDLRSHIRLLHEQAVRVPQQIPGASHRGEGGEPLRSVQDLHRDRRMGTVPRPPVARDRPGLPGIREHVDQDHHQRRGDRSQLGTEQVHRLQTGLVRAVTPRITVATSYAIATSSTSRRAQAIT